VGGSKCEGEAGRGGRRKIVREGGVGGGGEKRKGLPLGTVSPFLKREL